MDSRGRPRKAELNQVVSLRGSYGVVVEYRDDTKWGRYRVVRSDPYGRNAYGLAIWVDSTEFEPTDRFNRVPAVAYRKNQKIKEHRGCTCQCCYHVSAFEPDPKE